MAQIAQAPQIGTVQPLGGLNVGEGIRSIGSGILQGREEQRKQTQFDEQQEAWKQRQKNVNKMHELAENWNDKDARAFAMENPTVGSQLYQMHGAFKKEDQNQLLGVMNNIQATPEKTEQYLTDEIAERKSQGLPTTTYDNYLKEYQHNPEKFKNEVHSQLQFMDTANQEKIAKLKAGPKGEKGTWQLKDGMMLNTATGEMKKAPIGATDSTFTQYESLNKKDPKKGRAYGVQKGFVKFDTKQNPDGSYTRFYTDGTQQNLSPDEPAQVPGSSKKMSMAKANSIINKSSETTNKTAGFAVTMNQNLKTIDRLESEGVDPNAMSPAVITRWFSDNEYARSKMTPKQQEYFSAIEESINAIARRESGAAISDEEFKRFQRRYMPMPSDSKELVSKKHRDLIRQSKIMRGQSGAVYDALLVTGRFGNNEPETEEGKAQQQGGQPKPSQPQSQQGAGQNYNSLWGG